MVSSEAHGHVSVNSMKCSSATPVHSPLGWAVRDMEEVYVGVCRSYGQRASSLIGFSLKLNASLNSDTYQLFFRRKLLLCVGWCVTLIISSLVLATVVTIHSYPSSFEDIIVLIQPQLTNDCIVR